jgi:predicted RNase H-like HicB family nuclease
MTQSEPVASRDFAFMAVFEPAEEGGYVVRFPAIEGLVTEGESLDEAREMARDALRCFIEGQLMDGQPVPPSDVSPTETVREPVTLSVRVA